MIRKLWKNPHSGIRLGILPLGVNWLHRTEYWYQDMETVPLGHSLECSSQPISLWTRGSASLNASPQPAASMLAHTAEQWEPGPEERVILSPLEGTQVAQCREAVLLDRGFQVALQLILHFIFQGLKFIVKWSSCMCSIHTFSVSVHTPEGPTKIQQCSVWRGARGVIALHAILSHSKYRRCSRCTSIQSPLCSSSNPLSHLHLICADPYLRLRGAQCWNVTG